MLNMVLCLVLPDYITFSFPSVKRSTVYLKVHLRLIRILYKVGLYRSTRKEPVTIQILLGPLIKVGLFTLLKLYILGVTDV